MAYGVKTANIFDLLGEDGEDAPQIVEEPKQAAAKGKEADKPASSVAADVEARLKGKANGPVGGRTGGPGRGRGGGRGGRHGSDRPTRAEDGEVDVGGAGERNSRARIPRGKDLGKRHEHDRFDGTGRGHETAKREGAGKGNWGTIEEEIQVQEEAATEVKGAAADPTPEEPAEVPISAEAVEPPKEEKEMTLEEYEKMMEEKRANLNKKPATEAKADPNAFDGMKAYVRKSGDEENTLELTEKKQIGQRKSGLVEKQRKEKELLPTGFKFGQQEGGRGGRGRGFDRGGRRDDRPGGRGDRGDREGSYDRPPRRSDSGGQNGAREGGRGGRGGGYYGRGDRAQTSGGRGRGREGSVPGISDDKAFPKLE